jgi:8-oxo-dGTP pyrophosphatase MutT (NUDIX family)
VFRQNLLSLIQQYKNRFPGEVSMPERLEQFVLDNADCFQRSLLIGHVTGSAWILDKDREKTLLTHHRKLNKWLQPGGHADGDSLVSRVAMREAEEESGLEDLNLVSDEIFDIDIHLIPARKNEPEHYHYDCRFLIQCTGDETYTVSDESHDLAWIPLVEIKKYTDEPSILRMVDKT